MLDPKTIIDEVNSLARAHAERNTVMEDNYKLLLYLDEEQQDDMESFIGNDPRTLFNMAVYLLTPRPPQFTLEREDGRPFERADSPAAQIVAEFFTNRWSKLDRSYRLQGRDGFFRAFIGMLIATGHYFVSYDQPWEKQLPFVDFWNPHTAFPEWGASPGRGLIRLGRKLELPWNVAVGRAVANRWEVPKAPFSGMGIPPNVIEYQLFKSFDPGVYSQAVVIGNTLVKTWTMHQGGIPVIAGLAGGLPDNAIIEVKSKGHQGESLLATNAKLYRSHDRQQSWIQQMIRDTANPRWLEKNAGGKPILRPEDMFKRGAIFRAGINEDVKSLPGPGLPVEARASLFDVHNQIQRGGFSDVTFGNLQQEVSSLLVSQSADAAQPILESFKLAVENILTSITDAWFQFMLQNPSQQPKFFKDLPDAIKDGTHIIGKYSIKIPGDFQARIQTAKLMNPEYRLPDDVITDMLFPEITNKSAARASRRADEAMKHPSFALVSLLEAYDIKAAEAQQVGNGQMAQLYLQLKERIQQELFQTSPPPGSGGGGGQPTPEQIAASRQGAR